MKPVYIAIIVGAAAASFFAGITIFNTYQNIWDVEVKKPNGSADTFLGFEGTLSSGVLSAGETRQESIEVDTVGVIKGEFRMNFQGVSTVKYWIESPRAERLTGASHSSALFAVGDQNSLAMFMENSPPISEELAGKLVLVRYARAVDIEQLNLEGSIAIAERGGGPGEDVAFAEKELNVAREGTLALVIYNDEQGNFFGQLPSNSTYVPSIPVLSLSREEGLKLKELYPDNAVATLMPISDLEISTSVIGIKPTVLAMSNGTYEIGFHNEGPGKVEVMFVYRFEEGR